MDFVAAFRLLCLWVFPGKDTGRNGLPFASPEVPVRIGPMSLLCGGFFTTEPGGISVMMVTIIKVILFVSSLPMCQLGGNLFKQDTTTINHCGSDSDIFLEG